MPPWQSNLTIFIMLFGILGLALFWAKNCYCYWLCPFATIQEGMHLIGRFSLKPSPRWRRVLENVRFFLLWLILLLALLIGKTSITVFEPWNSIFALPLTVYDWLLLVISLTAAIFIRNFWCQYLCPVKAVLDIVIKVNRGFRRKWKKIRTTILLS